MSEYATSASHKSLKSLSLTKSAYGRTTPPLRWADNHRPHAHYDYYQLRYYHYYQLLSTTSPTIVLSADIILVASRLMKIARQDVWVSGRAIAVRPILVRGKQHNRAET